ncbi:MAG: single-stranded-DNA-specific exonuclease RecJ [Clostridia bacterium]|nr:single-stranded-DNA-specific exonuclease RecJ [Clostridia bacterium]
MTKRKTWHVHSRDDHAGAVSAIAQTLNIAFPTAQLLYLRGYKTPDEASSFLHLKSEILRDPFSLSDMDAACRRILSALENKEKIVIYGDYDVDGVTSVSLLCLYLKEKGADVTYYIPNRIGEGYGVNCEAVKKLVDEGATLMITVDTGVTAVEEIAYASSLGCDTVVTDHHECQDVLPKAVAVINPRRPDSTYPFGELAGVGVAFKLITALEYSFRHTKGIPTEGFLSDICHRYIDLVALGTVADVMPLRDENRLIVSMGLRLMDTSPRVGIKALLEAADGGKGKQKRKVTASTVGFTLAPRINAAGRMRTAARAVELFLTDSENSAAEVAADLCEINRMRQAEENKIVEQIAARIAADPTIGEAPVIVMADEGWNHGVIGIVSSRITEKYNRPSILISFEDGVGKGSGRSVKGLNLVDALTHCSDLLVKYGGHELAAGLTVKEEDLPAFKERLNAYAREHLGDEEPEVTLEIDCELSLQEISLRQAEELTLLEPCGTANPVPLFLMRDLTVIELIPIGSGHHTKLILEKDGEHFPAVFFGSSPEELGYLSGDHCDIAFNLNVNEFQGHRSEQLILRDMRLSPEQEEEGHANLAEYREARHGASHLPCELLPKREDFVAVYLRLKRSLPAEGGDVSLRSLLNEMSDTPGANGPMTYTRLRLVLDVLADAGILLCEETELSRPGQEVFRIALTNPKQKVDLEKSCILKQLTARTTTPV